MILAVDVDYGEQGALVAGVLFKEWFEEKAEKILYTEINKVNEYKSGEFYRRELPCILSLIEEHKLKPSVIVIDGYVSLGEKSCPGLGKYLYDALNGETKIIGVAKKPYKDTPYNTNLLRGKSSKPLYVTTVGVELDVAKGHIKSMHGKNRIPSLLKLADTACRRKLTN